MKDNIEPICELGRAVIEKEAAAILNLIPRIDDSFVQACELLLQCSGRIVVIGIGKSGHIGRKLAATLASTGNPAFFVHPGEAKHGDMGMITREDIAIVLSNSGETEEILAILPVIKRLNVPLIALTGKSSSTLAKAATVNLHVGVSEEACPLGLAPTSSTTAALVMGDALALVLQQQRGFTMQDFALSHPGDQLSQYLLLTVDNIMHQGAAMPKVHQAALLKNALLEMTQKKLGMTIVVNDNQELAGIFTDGDVRRVLESGNTDVYHAMISEVMNAHPKSISPGMLAVDALNILEANKITSLVVADENNKPLGVVHIHDILRAGIVKTDMVVKEKDLLFEVVIASS